jgi:AAA domain (dynein-related subfamily)
MAIEATPVQAKEVLEKNIRAGLVTMLKGSPGTAKSAIVREMADRYNLKLIDLRLSQCESVDLHGFPSIDQEKQKASYIPFSTFPIQGDQLPTGKDGWLLFLDEFNSADRGVQRSAYKLILDRMIGEFTLHDRVAMVAAGNLDTDGAIVEEMSSAMQSRICHLRVRPDNDNWLAWAAGAGIDHRVLSFIRFKPQNLYTFDPEKIETQETYACYRTWEFAHKQLQQMPDVLNDATAMMTLAGSLGEGVAREFMAFLRIYGTLPDIADIIKDPKGVKVPSEPGTQYALSGALAQNANDKNIGPLIAFIERLPMEFQVITLQGIRRQDESLVQSKPLQAWLSQNNTELF